jgi:hypothetical protein
VLLPGFDVDKTRRFPMSITCMLGDNEQSLQRGGRDMVEQLREQKNSEPVTQLPDAGAAAVKSATERSSTKIFH